MAVFPRFRCVEIVRRLDDRAKTGRAFSAFLYVRNDAPAGFGPDSTEQVTPMSQYCNMLHVLARQGIEATL